MRVLTYASYLPSRVVPARVGDRTLLPRDLRRSLSAGHPRPDAARAPLARPRLRRLIARLRAGGSIALFPEGTFVAAPGLLHFHDGGFLMPAQAGVPAVPAVIRGTRRALGDGQWRLRPGPADVDLHPAIAPAGRARSDVLDLREHVRAVILTHCSEPDAAGAPA